MPGDPENFRAGISNRNYNFEFRCVCKFSASVYFRLPNPRRCRRTKKKIHYFINPKIEFFFFFYLNLEILSVLFGRSFFFILLPPPLHQTCLFSLPLSSHSLLLLLRCVKIAFVHFVLLLSAF